jgi:hypothetical protein
MTDRATRFTLVSAVLASLLLLAACAEAPLDGDPSPPHGPFTYEVEIELDGLTDVAVADWPADEIVGNEPSVELNLTPDLPSLS